MTRWLYKLTTSLSTTCLKEETVDHLAPFIISNIDHIKSKSTSIIAIFFPLDCFSAKPLYDIMDNMLNKSQSPSPHEMIPLRWLKEIIIWL